MMEETKQSVVPRMRSYAGKSTFMIFLGLLFILPFFFIPSSNVIFGMSKALLVIIGTAIATVSFVVSIIRGGKLTVPKNLFFLSVLLIPVVFLISAIANGSSAISFLGYAIEPGTVIFVFFSALLLFLVSEVFDSKEQIFYGYLAFFASFAVVALFQLIRVLFGPDVLSFGIFTSSITNLVGNWNDLGIFFGISAILSLVSLEMLQMNKVFKALVYVAFIVSLFFLTLVNFVTIWAVLAVFSLIFFVYIISFSRFAPSQEFAGDMQVNGTEPQGVIYSRKVSVNSLVLLIVSVLFLISGSSIGAKISEVFQINNVEVRPAWSTTLAITKSALGDNALVGSGPNQFSKLWVMHKPDGINDTIFWNTDFSYGIGIIPTFFATTGILGILAWVFFFVMFVWVGLRAIFYSLSDLFSRFLITSSFMIALFLWIMAVLYVPSPVIFALTFFFTGLFAASLRREGLLKTKVLSLVDHPKLSFVAVLLLVALIIGNITLAYLATTKAIAATDFQSGVATVQSTQDLDKGEASIVKAIALGGYDTYYRGLSQVNLLRVNALLAKPGATPESIREPFQQTLGNAIENARQATVVDPNNYQNWLALAQVYASLVPAPFAIPGAYENAKSSYESAQKVSPRDPSIPLLLARLEVSHSDLPKAREFANQAIAMKPNFAEAHFLVAQIEATEGNVSQAIPSLETTLLLAPNNPGLFFQLGLLKYDQKDFNGSIDSFTKAITLVPDYANAKYFLGLAYQKVGRVPEAIIQFQDIQKANPDNLEIQNILSNLEAGKDPFANVPPPNNRPEKADKLPLDQTN